MSASLRLVICTAVFAALLGFGIHWVNGNRAIVEAEQRLLLNQIVADQALAIERRLARSLLAANFLAIEVPRDGGRI